MPWNHSHTIVLVAALLLAAPIGFASAGASKHTVYDFKLRSIDGKKTSLSQYKGKVLLIVNTASKCGFTPQYEGLETVYQRYHDRGFEVLAFPANNFGQQEPGTDAEIKTFCSTQYKTTFPLFSKISVKGGDMHPLYVYLTRDSGFPGDIKWNFTKFLVAPDGHIAARFDSKQDPASDDVTQAIEKLLPQSAVTQ